MAGAAILSILALMPSSPVALWVGTESNKSTTLFCVILGRSNDPVPSLGVVIVEGSVSELSFSAATKFFG